MKIYRPPSSTRRGNGPPWPSPKYTTQVRTTRAVVRAEQPNFHTIKRGTYFTVLHSSYYIHGLTNNYCHTRRIILFKGITNLHNISH